MPDRKPPPDSEQPTESAGGQIDHSSTPLKRIGDFDLLSELGRGGMGIVYEARQISLNRRVALKVLPPGLGLTETAVQRFEREARAAAKLHHTNIVPVHAIGEEEGCHYYAMELIEGQPLSDVLRDLTGEGSNPLLDATVTKLGEGETPESRPDPTKSQEGTSITSLSDTESGSRKWFDAVAKLIADVADALDYAHGRGVIHRDIKPANLMLSREGKLCVTDFGLARVAQEPGMTVSGSLMGTPAYMSPEQIAVGRVKLDHRTDIYSLGAVLYELLAHQRPFPGDSREEILSGILTKDPRPPRRYNPRIPVDLETICQKAMEKDPDRRYQNAGEFAADLRQYMQGGLIAARRAGLPRRTWKSIRRHPVAALGVAAGLVVVAVAVVAWQAGGRAETAQRLVADARLALREGTYRDGLELIDRAAEMDPGSIEARLVRARLLMANYRTREAVDEARSVLDDEPENWMAHAILAAVGRWPVGQYRMPSIPVEQHIKVVEEKSPESATAYFLRAMTTETNLERRALLDRALELDPGDSVALNARIIVAQDLKDYEGMLSIAERLIAARPRSGLGWRWKGYGHMALSDPAQAWAANARALELDDGDPWNYIQRAWIHREAGDLEECVEDLTRAIELDPEHAFIYVNRSQRLSDLGRFEQAVADARKSIELFPESRTAYSELLRAKLSLGDEEGMREVLDELRIEADSWADAEAKGNAYQHIAHNYLQLKDYDRAMAAVERAIEVDPGGLWNFMMRRRIHNALGDFDAAQEDCEAAAAIELPAEPVEFSNRGWRMSFECRLHDQAISDFTRAIELAPHWDDPYRGRGTSYYFLQRYEEALADLNQSIELNPNVEASYNNRSIILEQLRRYEEAIEDKERAVEMSPHNPSPITNLGVAYLWRGRRQDALHQSERALEINPRFVTALTNAAAGYLWSGRLEEAIETARRAIEVDPDKHGHANYHSQAMAHMGLGRPQEARSVIEEMLRRAEGWMEEAASSAHTIASSWFIYLDDIDAALGAAERAIELDPDNYDSHIVRAVVRRHLGDSAGWSKDCRKAASIDLTAAGKLIGRARNLGNFCALWDAARRDAERALALVPNDPEALRLRGQTQEYLGELAAAKENFDRAVQADPRDRWTLTARTRHHAMRGNCEAAKTDLARAKEAGEQDPQVWAGVAGTHALLFHRNCPAVYDGADALDLARRAASALPPDEWESTHSALGFLLYREGQYEEAREALEKALEYSLIEEPTELFALAMVQAKLGDATSARDTYRRAVARMREVSTSYPLYVQLRREAAGVIGIEP